MPGWFTCVNSYRGGLWIVGDHRMCGGIPGSAARGTDWADCDGADKPDGDGGTDGDLHGDGERIWAADLPVVQEWRCHKRSDFKHLHYTGDCGWGQRSGVYGGGIESGG
jgi:hypothetical protein